MPSLLLASSLLALLFAFNGFRPRYAPATLAAVSFVAGWLATELGFHFAALELVVTIALVRAGALASWAGQVGLAAGALAMVGLVVAWRGGPTRDAIAAALREALPEDPPEPIGAKVAHAPWRQLAFPIPVTHPEVGRERDLVYFEDGKLRLKLDVFIRRDANRDAAARRPVMVFVHGGAWVIGSKDHHGLPLMQHFAARGWVCFSINYRLSPRATFPDHVVDVKRALAWVHAHAAEWGGDPDFVVVSGGSAGGHLASLAALTANRAELQPGFEAADTSTAACVSFYGVYDFTDRHDHWHHPGLLRLLERHVIKARRHEAAERFAAASPASYLHAGAPPFLIIHGDRDTLVPVAEGRAFYARLRAVSDQPCVYFEIPGAQHAFEIFPSPRTLHVLRGVEQFLDRVHAHHRQRASVEAPRESPRS